MGSGVVNITVCVFREAPVRRRVWGRRAAWAVATAILGAPETGAAGDDEWRALSLPAAQHPTQELSAGADVTSHAWSVYSTFTATFGSDVRRDGWRYRLVSGYGQYDYSSSRWTGASVVTVPFDGTVTFADALLGYQKSMGAMTVKLFAGAAMQHHEVTPFDVASSVQGLEWGAKALIETWVDLGEQSYGQLDLSYTTVFQSYSARARLGYRFWPHVSLGLEGALAGNADYDAGRGGAFVRYEWVAGEVSLSGGVAADRSEVTGAYGTLNALFRF
jgi:hypothetical protein